MDGHAMISFMIGIFDEGKGEYSIVPYTYRSGSQIWAEDCDGVRGIEKDRRYSGPMIRKDAVE